MEQETAVCERRSALAELRLPFPVVHDGEKPHQQHFRFRESASLLTRVSVMPYGHGEFNRRQQKHEAEHHVNQYERKPFLHQQAQAER